jgi:hypothetical protein
MHVHERGDDHSLYRASTSCKGIHGHSVVSTCDSNAISSSTREPDVYKFANGAGWDVQSSTVETTSCVEDENNVYGQCGVGTCVHDDFGRVTDPRTITRHGLWRLLDLHVRYLILHLARYSLTMREQSNFYGIRR